MLYEQKKIIVKAKDKEYFLTENGFRDIKTTTNYKLRFFNCVEQAKEYIRKSYRNAAVDYCKVIERVDYCD